MRPIQCQYCGVFEPTSEHFINFRCSLRPSHLEHEFEVKQNSLQAEVELQPVQELCAA
jgi:hypothetical protein